LLFFDFSAMEPEQIERSVDAAKKFVGTKMQPADLIALVSLATNMRVTWISRTTRPNCCGADRVQFRRRPGFRKRQHGKRGGRRGDERSLLGGRYGFQHVQRRPQAPGAAVADAGGWQTPAKKEPHLFQQWNQPVGHGQPVGLARHDRSGGEGKRIDYSLDVRGLQAFPPGGEAQSASLHGQSAYSGQSVLNDLNGNAGSQETLATLSSDTGARRFLIRMISAAYFPRFRRTARRTTF